MKLSEYLKELNKLVTERPELLELEIVTSIDDEGNGFNKVHYGPTVGFYDEYDFTGENDEECPDVNAVCLN